MTRRSRQVLAVLALALATAACDATGPAEASPPPSAPLTWGVFVPDDGAPSSDLGVVAAMAGEEPEYVMRFAATGEDVPLDHLTAISDAGMTPILTLEPWVPEAGASQPAYTLDRIAAGEHDADLRRWAAGLADFGRPVLLRFAHEMNGDWYPWSVGIGGTAADYVAAWTHVHGLVRAAGADDVRFVWSPNVPLDGATDPADAYPGPETVDVLGLDGYNWGAGGGHTWVDPEALFADGLELLRELDGDLPILVAETASAEGPRAGLDKALWIRDLVEYLDGQERVVGFVWFQADKERDWRFNSSAEAEAAFREALGQRRS